MTALVTPFRDGDVDWACLQKLVDRQIEGGTDWLVPCGTTGESATLDDAEQQRILDTVLATAAGRCPVMAGTGSNNTAESVRRTRRAAKAGAAAALVVVPYYNRPPQEGLFRHYAKIAESAEIPIVLYNVPPRTGVSLTNDTVVRLREGFANIVAIKHATGSVEGVTELRGRCDIAVLSGDDPLTWPLMALGAVGVVSVLSNLCPSLLKSLVSAGKKGDCAAALRYHARVHDLAAGIGRYGPNPLPIKTAMAINGLLEEEFRLPLCPLEAEARNGIELVLRRHELLEKRTA
jgi:4-hydroxy-tetrahydrodipicolinate synthase